MEIIWVNCILLGKRLNFFWKFLINIDFMIQVLLSFIIEYINYLCKDNEYVFNIISLFFNKKYGNTFISIITREAIKQKLQI